MQIGVKSFSKGDYDKIPLCGAQKNKANLPAIGRKSEARNTKSDNSGDVAGCLLPRVGRETS